MPSGPPAYPWCLTRDEVRAVIRQLRGVHRLIALLLYGAGLRLLEGARVRVKDIDFARHQIMSGRDIKLLWSRITAPTLLLYGKESWSGDPGADGRAALFNNASVAGFEGAGHWLHHDRLDEFLRVLRDFLKMPVSPAANERTP